MRTATDTNDEQVVLLSDEGAPIGSVSKAAVHGFDTPLHLAFSCHVRNLDGEVLDDFLSDEAPIDPARVVGGRFRAIGPGEKVQQLARLGQGKILDMVLVFPARCYPEKGGTPMIASHPA